MTKGFACAAALAVASLPAPLPAAAQGEQGKAVSPTTLTDADRAEIQKLTSGYNEFIGTCKPESYAKLFESQRGYFESLSRGRVWGQEALVGLVKSELSCAPDAKNLRSRDTAPAVISVTERGVVGRVTASSGPGAVGSTTRPDRSRKIHPTAVGANSPLITESRESAAA